VGFGFFTIRGYLGVRRSLRATTSGQTPPSTPRGEAHIVQYSSTARRAIPTVSFDTSSLSGQGRRDGVKGKPTVLPLPVLTVRELASVVSFFPLLHSIRPDSTPCGQILFWVFALHESLFLCYKLLYPSRLNLAGAGL
jgi:hypothetical protein